MRLSKNNLIILLIGLLCFASFGGFAQSGIVRGADQGHETILFSDDFESYPVGSFPSQGGWELVFDGRGAEYQVVTSLKSFSGSKSLQLWGMAWWSAVAQRRFQTDAKIIGCEEAIMISDRNPNPSGTPYEKACSFWNRELGPWGKRYVYVLFDHRDLKIKCHDGEDMVILGSWSPQVWYKIKLILNRETNLYKVWINGEYKGEFEAHPGFDDPYKINALELASEHPGVRVYHDDVKVFEVEEYYLRVYFSSAVINEKSIDASNPVIVVAPGERLKGFFEVRVVNNRGGPWITPVIGVASWMRGSVACIKPDAPTGESTQRWSFDLTAPSEPGTYYIGIFAGWWYTCDEVASQDHPARYGDGDDVWDMPSQGWEEVIMYGHARTGPYRQEGRAIRIVVSGGYPTVSIGSYELSLNSTQVIPVIIKNASLVAGGAINIAFDNSIIEVLDVTAGDFPTIVPNINNDEGFVSISVASMEACGKSEAILARIHVRGISIGETPLTIIRAELSDENGNLITPNVEHGFIRVLEVLRGDLNRNGRCDVGDAVIALRMSSGVIEPTPEDITIGDVNGNGKIDIGDAVLILRCATGLR